MAGLLKSFRNSLGGLRKILAERMFQIELVCGLVVIALTYLRREFSSFDRLVIVTFVFMVLVFEGFNTSLEKLLDFIESKYSEKVGGIKDMLGGTVLIGIIGAIVVGTIIVLRLWLK